MNRKQGFTLAEMAIVIVIAGILLVMGLKTATGVLNSTQVSATSSKLASLRTALMTFYLQNHFFPCPEAGGTAGGQQGLEGRAAAAPRACNTGLGTIPFQTMGIPRQAALDAWGNYITYIIDRTSNYQGVTYSSNAPSVVSGAPQVVGSAAAPQPATNWTLIPSALAPFCARNGTPPPPPPTATNPWVPFTRAAGAVPTIRVAKAAGVIEVNSAIIVLVSHGPNGLGAFNTAPAAADRNPLPPAASPEFANTQVPAAAGVSTYNDFAFSDSATTPFDDQVTTISQSDLMALATSTGRYDFCF